MTSCCTMHTRLLASSVALLCILPGCDEDRPGIDDSAVDVFQPDSDGMEATVPDDSGVDAGDATVFCPDILMRQTAPELVDHGPGMYCGPNCRQVTFADSMYRYDVWGDYVVYVSHYGSSGAKNAYLAKISTGEEWRLETGPWSQPGSTRITIDDGVVGWVYARYPSQGLYLVEFVRTYDIESQTYTDLTCIEHENDEVSVIFDLDSTANTLVFNMSNECRGCKDLYSISLLDGLLTKRTVPGLGVVETRADGQLAIWTEVSQPQADVMSFDLITEEITNISNHSADQFRARKRGERIVWVDHRNDAGGYLNQRNSDIYYHDLTLGETYEVSIDLALQDEPDIDGDIVVWEDWRNNPNPVPVLSTEFHNSDIYMKDLSTGVETQLTDFASMEAFPRVHGNRVFFRMDDGNGEASVFMIEL